MAIIEILNRLLKSESRANNIEALEDTITYIESQDDVIKSLRAYNEVLVKNNSTLKKDKQCLEGRVSTLEKSIISYAESEIEERCA